MDNICDCYYTVGKRRPYYSTTTGACIGSYPQTVGYCRGTREQDACDCMGDISKCDFYPEKREQATKIKEFAEEDGYKFYYCDSEDSYLLGKRLDNFYYAHWYNDIHEFVWDMSKYLPWGEHVISETSLWKEHTFPSEPREIAASEWFKGFLRQWNRKDCVK